MKQDRDLESLLGYQIDMAHLTMVADARKKLAPFAVTPAKLTAMLLIRANPGCDQTALGRALRINRSSVMKLVNYLAERTLVERHPGRDLRTNALHLSAEGEARLVEMVACLRESDRRMTAGLTAEERATLATLVRKLRQPRETSGTTTKNTRSTSSRVAKLSA
ncbi:MarR family transcriptional regulator [Sphingomonas sp. So64.6b]|uniref:MarR family winged helix-turn-helix transcriptional regulator n=1 Tax=Sphingomonas sp. So64.6b TaxID=2997354 RepID=UPI0016030B45|nr:MarR family transcriptional regulator [Sphingomonas sp. So64.6b]QNA83539.1 MarR family transcriptional regulator [Sphingomonas sp. So64.6b]